MASLSGNSTNGTPNWTKYVKNNTQWNTLEYLIETPAGSPTYLFAAASNTKPEQLLFELPAGTKIKILSTSTTKITANAQALKGKSINAFTQKEAARCKIGAGMIGYVLISKIKKPTKAPDSVEKRTISMAQSNLDELKRIAKIGTSRKNGVDIEVDGFGLLQDCCTISKVPDRVNGREAKADIVIKDSKNKDLIYISHKAGGGAKAFQQYGGVSETAGTQEMPGMIYQHPEVEKFLIDLYDLYNEAMTGNAPQSNPFDKNGRLTVGRLYRPIRSADLIGKSVFGPGYGGPSGIDCVDVIAQGPFKFKGFMTSEEDIAFRLTWDHFDYRGGDIDDFNDGMYQALLVSRSASDRRTKTPKGDIQGLRTGIFNRSYLSGTSLNIDALV